MAEVDRLAARPSNKRTGRELERAALLQLTEWLQQGPQGSLCTAFLVTQQ
jgi:hypothetical protein